MNWSLENIELLRSLWAEGFSCSQIAARMGTTKNSIIGKSHRLQLPARADKQRSPYKKPVRRSPRRPSMPKAAGTPVKVKMPVPPPPSGPGVSIVDVTGCRFAIASDETVYGGFRFCNHEQDGASPWCAYHRQVCCQKVNPDAKPKRFKIPTALLRIAA